MDKKKCNCPPTPPKGHIAPRIGWVARMERINFNKAVSEEGLFAGQHKIIMFIKMKGSATIGQIAEETGTAPSTVSVSIKRMEKAGFVKRKPSKTDGRITEIYLTEKGNAIPDNIRRKMNEEEQMLTYGLTQSEIDTLSDLLDKVIDNFKKKEALEECLKNYPNT